MTNQHTTLFASGNHRNILLPDFSAGGVAVQANQHLIIHGAEAMILDPGGHKVYSRVLAATSQQLQGARLKYLFFSHQDPDIIAASNGWLMTTDAEAYISALWTRFVPHFGLDHLVIDRLKPIPDEGMTLSLGGAKLVILPAHFLHSPGNFHVYDETSKILYSGDLGAALGAPGVDVTDFDAHLAYMEGFHRRYMASNVAMRRWAAAARQLDIECIAPQHGQMFRGRELVQRFISWAEALPCGVDLMTDPIKIPG